MKRKVIIGILGFVIAIIIFLIFNGIYIQEEKNDNSKLEIAGCQTEEIRLYYQLSNKNIYTYDIELIRVNKNGKYQELKDILSNNENYIEEFIENMEYVDTLKDGGTKIYKNDNIIYIDNCGHKKGFYLYECNTLDGSKDIYIGSEKLKDYDKVCSMPKGIDSACLESTVGGYISSEKTEFSEIPLGIIMKCDCILDYSSIKSTSLGIYAIIKTDNEEVIDEFDSYFNKNYNGYQKASLEDNYIVYVYNGFNDFDLANDLNVCVK